jgi:parallel beta-helix repeat protein
MLREFQHTQGEHAAARNDVDVKPKTKDIRRRLHMKTKHQRSNRSCVIHLPLTVAVTLLVVFNVSSALASSGTMHITSSTTLTEDHYGNIVIEGNNITLDCAGRTVSGPGVDGFSGGIQVQFSTGITVKRCKVTAFAVNGIYAAESSNCRYENNKIVSNGANGMHLDGGVGNLVTGNTSRSNNGIGIALTRGTQSLIEHNILEDNRPWAGVALLEGSHHNMVVANTSTRNGIGYLVDGSAENDLISNSANSNSGAGFLFIRNANSNSAWLNASNRNEIGFHVTDSSSQNLLSRNTANDNQLYGFNLQFNANSNTLMGNLADENGVIGFLAWTGSSYNVVSRNVAHDNVQLDGLDDLSGIGNIWTGNRFVTTNGF